MTLRPTRTLASDGKPVDRTKGCECAPRKACVIYDGPLGVPGIAFCGA